jgi:hypothetical protein
MVTHTCTSTWEAEEGLGGSLEPRNSNIARLSSTESHTCNPGTWEAEIRMNTVQGQHRQKMSEIPPSQQISQAWWYMSVIPAMQEA